MSEDMRVQCRCGAFYESGDSCPVCGSRSRVDMARTMTEALDQRDRARAERDRLRAVVDAAQEFDAAWSAWQGKIERGEIVSSTDSESLRRAASIAALRAAVRQLDESAEITDG